MLPTYRADSILQPDSLVITRLQEHHVNHIDSVAGMLENFLTKNPIFAAAIPICACK